MARQRGPVRVDTSVDMRPGTKAGNAYLAKQDRVRQSRGYHGRTIKGARELVDFEAGSTLGNKAAKKQSKRRS